MVTVSLVGLVAEGLAYAAGGVPGLMIAGLLTGVTLVEVGDRLLDRVDVGTTGARNDATDTPTAETDGGDDHAVEARAVAEGDPKTLLLVLGILTVHSFPEGVAVGVSFAELGLDGGIAVLGTSVPVLAVFMTVAISIHNVPEGTAIAIPMRAMGLSNWRMVGAAVFSSLPQPVGAVVAYAFVTWARSFLPFGYGFAAGAMVYLVASRFVPEALEAGRSLPNGGYRELALGFGAGAAAMSPLLFV